MAAVPDPEQTLTWLTQCRSGIKASCELLGQAILVRIQLFISLRLREHPVKDREDVVQEIMATFWELHRGITTDPPRFALRIGRLKVLEYFARRRRGFLSQSIEGDDDGLEPAFVADEPPIDQILFDKERVAAILKAIHNLDEFDQRLIKGLLAGYKLAEIFDDEQLNDPKLTRTNFDVKKLRCIHKLQEYLSNQL